MRNEPRSIGFHAEPLVGAGLVLAPTLLCLSGMAGPAVPGSAAVVAAALAAVLLTRRQQRVETLLRDALREHADDTEPHPVLERQDVFGAVAREMAALREALDTRSERLTQQLSLDTVTGLPNRIVVGDRIAMANARARRARSAFALLVVEVRQLSNINNRFGHQAGDRILRLLAQRIREQVRETDSVCRLCNDQFLVILEEGGDTDLLRVAMQLSGLLNPTLSVGERQLRVRIACGLALCNAGGGHWETLLRRADIARQTARDRGERFAIYEDGQDETHLRQITLQDDFHDAVCGNQMQVLYQPKMVLDHRRVTQVEALVRWHHPEFGPVPPDEFIPLAERTGQIRILSHWVLEQVMRQIRHWDELGLNIVVAVNLSPLDLSDRQIVHVLKTLTRGFGVRPDQLILEVTESAILEDVSSTMEIIEALRGAGYGIAIDDFGTGYSSLAQLRQLPVRELKIDRSFVMRMQNSADDAVIVRSTIEMAHNMGLEVVAEGVEDEAVSALLASWNCDMIQGYHLSRPMDSASLASWLKERMTATGGAA